jgi:hypothetical protein
MQGNEPVVAALIFSVVVSYSSYMVKWFYGAAKTSHERYRQDTLVLLTRQENKI